MSVVQDYFLLIKPRLTSLVLFATGVGFYFGSPQPLDFPLLFETLLGTGLVAVGASALNQVLERSADAQMQRTRSRPLPTGRLDADRVLCFGAVAAIAGMLDLAARANLQAGLWAAATLALYVFVYTPLKRLTTLNTLAGALPGALPPLIGWTAAGEQLMPGAWCLFAIVFIWQLPHFLSIAWLYRQDYARAGFRMLPGVDPEGFSTGRQIALHSFTLLPLSALPYFLRMSGEVYLGGAALLSAAFLAVGIAFAVQRSDLAARRLFFASVAYLPALLTLMMFDRM